MKKLFYLLLSLVCNLTALAQTTPAVNQDKLLEFYQTQHYSEAAAYLKSVYGAETENPKELSQLAYANMMAGNLPLAEKVYRKLLQQQPASLSVLFNLASISRRRGDNVNAKSYYLEIIKTDSLNFSVYKQLAAMVTNPAEPEKLFYLKKANIINPIDPDVAFDLANGFNLSNKNDSAFVILKPALAADSSNIVLMKEKLPVCLALNKLDEAILTGVRLLNMGDSSTYVLNYMGKVYLATKQYQKSLQLFNSIEQHGDQNELTLYYTALCYRELKDYPCAADYMGRTIKEGISPLTSNYYKIQGEVFEKNMQVPEANQAYQKSLQFENKGEVYYNLALLNEFKLNHKKTALKYYNQFLRSKPDPEKYKEVIPYVKDRIRLLQK